MIKIAEKLQEPFAFHILVDMKVPTVYLSFKGNSDHVKTYMDSTKSRNMIIRHIKVEGSTIKVGTKDNEVVI